MGVATGNAEVEAERGTIRQLTRDFFRSMEHCSSPERAGRGLSGKTVRFIESVTPHDRQAEDDRIGGEYQPVFDPEAFAIQKREPEGGVVEARKNASCVLERGGHAGDRIEQSAEVAEHEHERRNHRKSGFSIDGEPDQDSEQGEGKRRHP